MLPCNACHRHIHADEGKCPFCGSVQRRESSPLRDLVGVIGALGVGVALLGSSACTTDPGSEDPTNTSTSPTTDDPSTTTDTTESGSESSTTSTFTDTDDSTDPQTNTSGGFYAGPDVDIGGIQDCDPFAQDCPEGEKCVPYASTGSGWNANKCVAIMGDGQAGEDCTYGGWVEATDDCGADTHCWNVMDIEGMNIGTCTPFCTGTIEDPICAPGSACLVDDVINLCIELCDPVAQDCEDGTACYWTGQDFNCVVTTQDIPTGGDCAFLNDCAGGNFCAAAQFVPGCASDGCCAAYCALDDLEACPEPEVECVPFFEDPAPEGYEQVGVCISPPP